MFKVFHSRESAAEGKQRTGRQIRPQRAPAAHGANVDARSMKRVRTTCPARYRHLTEKRQKKQGFTYIIRRNFGVATPNRESGEQAAI
jgi:hypothetical protein